MGNTFFSYSIWHITLYAWPGKEWKHKAIKSKRKSHTESVFPPLFSSFQSFSGDVKFFFLFSYFVNIRREKHILQIFLFFTNVVDFIISPIICSPFLVRILYIFTLQFPPIKGILHHPMDMRFGHVTYFGQSYLSRCDNTVFPGHEDGMSYIGAASPAWAWESEAMWSRIKPACSLHVTWVLNKPLFYEPQRFWGLFVITAKLTRYQEWNAK